MKTILLTILLMIVSQHFGQSLESEIQLLFDNQVKSDRIEESSLRVYCPSKGIDFSAAYSKNDSIDAEQPFYTASIGKMFTAVSIAILKEKGLLDFEDLISKHLPAHVLEDLHSINDTSYANQITIAHLLQHTSGLADYFEDNTYTGQPKLIDQLFVFPNKTWTPIEILEFYKMNLKSKFIPGTGYHYTDTEYLLLGLIIENITKKPLHEFLESEIIIPLSLNNTYLNLKSKPITKTKKMMKVMVEDIDISDYKSLSADWAGGGIVSTNSDLIKFFTSLTNGKLIKPKTFKLMQNWTQESLGMDYGFGLSQISFNKLSFAWDNMNIIGHSGVTGAFLFYCPELDTYISGSFNQVELNRQAVQLMYDILMVVKSKG